MLLMDSVLVCSVDIRRHLLYQGDDAIAAIREMLIEHAYHMYRRAQSGRQDTMLADTILMERESARTRARARARETRAAPTRYMTGSGAAYAHTYTNTRTRIHGTRKHVHTCTR